jgi:peptidoglycan/LPS O-acetylase OafA/YrhL
MPRSWAPQTPAAIVAHADKPTGTHFYRPELDVLRFFAFFAVFLTHSLTHSADTWVSYGLPRSLGMLLAAVAGAGAFGVSLFFMLSAYLITTLLLGEKQTTNDVHLRSFYFRRILRIWPLYFFMLAVASLWPVPDMRMPLRSTSRIPIARRKLDDGSVRAATYLRQHPMECFD